MVGFFDTDPIKEIIRRESGCDESHARHLPYGGSSIKFIWHDPRRSYSVFVDGGDETVEAITGISRRVRSIVAKEAESKVSYERKHSAVTSSPSDRVKGRIYNDMPAETKDAPFVSPSMTLIDDYIGVVLQLNELIATRFADEVFTADYAFSAEGYDVDWGEEFSVHCLNYDGSVAARSAHNGEEIRIRWYDFAALVPEVSLVLDEYVALNTCCGAFSEMVNDFERYVNGKPALRRYAVELLADRTRESRKQKEEQKIADTEEGYRRQDVYGII